MTLFARSPTGLFASTSLAGHLIRGAIGILLMAWAIENQAQTAASLTAAFGALLAFRGCPACWMIGLGETLVQKWKARRAG